MASNRDKLRAASKRNMQDSKTILEQPTLVTNMVNQLNTVNQTPESTESIESVESVKPNESIVQPATPTLSAAIETIEKPERNGAVEAETIKTNFDSEMEVSNEPEALGEPETIGESETNVNDNETLKFEKATGVPPINLDDYAESDCILTVLMLPDVEKFLTRTANRLRIPVKTLFKTIMVNAVKNGEIIDPDDELLNQYRTYQRYQTRRSISTSSKLRDELKELAALNEIRYSPFISYTIHKAMLRAAELQSKENNN